MTEVTLYPQIPSTLSSNIQEEEEKNKETLSTSISLTSENSIFCIDPLLLICICSFLDMLSVMRFECVSLRFYKFLKKNLNLQSMDLSNTDYFIDNALKKKEKIKSAQKQKETIPIFSSLKYRFPNLHQYEHYILLETDKNIFGKFQYVKELHLRIIPPNSSDFVSNPSSSYLAKAQKHQRMNEEQKETLNGENSEENEEKNLDFALLHSANNRQFTSRAPITKVETSIYSRSILSYFDNYFHSISHLIIEFNPYLFTSQFLTFSIPKILSKITKLSLLKCTHTQPTNCVSSKDIYCHETVSLLQYTRNLKQMTFNFPLSSDFYPILNNLESLKIMHRIEQPILGNLFDSKSNSVSAPSPYAQNIATINANKTTIISHVKLQKSMIHFFCPSIRSLHFHGSKGVQHLFNENDEYLTQNVVEKHKVFFGLTELCIHCSQSIYCYISTFMYCVPQLRRLQLIFGKHCKINYFLLILQHFEANFVLNYSYNPSKDSLLSYYYKYYVYYGFNLENRASKLRHIQVVTKKTTHAQNYEFLHCFCEFLKKSKMTLLNIRILVHYQYWSTSDLMNVIELFSKNQIVFGRDSMSYQIIMPLRRKYAKHANFGGVSVNKRENVKKKMVENVKNDYQKMNDEKTEKVFLNGVIDQNSLKGIASYIKQKKVGNLHIVSSENGMREEDIVIMEKLRVDNEERKKYQKYKDFYFHSNDEKEQKQKRDDRNVYKEKIAQKLLKCVEIDENDTNEKENMFVENESKWINECYYCDLFK